MANLYKQNKENQLNGIRIKIKNKNKNKNKNSKRQNRNNQNKNDNKNKNNNKNKNDNRNKNNNKNKNDKNNGNNRNRKKRFGSLNVRKSGQSDRGNKVNEGQLYGQNSQIQNSSGQDNLNNLNQDIVQTRGSGKIEREEDDSKQDILETVGGMDQSFSNRPKTFISPNDISLNLDDELQNLQQHQLEEIQENKQNQFDQNLAFYTQDNPSYDYQPTQQQNQQQSYAHANGQYRPRYNHGQRQQMLQHPEKSGFVSSKYAREIQTVQSTGYGPTRNSDYYGDSRQTNHNYMDNYNQNHGNYNYNDYNNIGKQYNIENNGNNVNNDLSGTIPHINVIPANYKIPSVRNSRWKPYYSRYNIDYGVGAHYN